MSLDLGVLLQAAVGNQFTNGLWAGTAREGCPTPYGQYTYTLLTKSYLSKQPGMPDKRAALQQAEVEINIFADTAAICTTVADAVEDAMEQQLMDASPTSFTSTQLSRESLPQDPVTYARRVMMRFSVWFRPKG